MHIYKSLKQIKVIFILSLIFFMWGCVSSPKEESPEQQEKIVLNNRLTLNKHTIYLPSDWVYVQNSLYTGTLFDFKSSNGIEGGLEHITFDFDIDTIKLKNFYIDNVFESDSKIETETLNFVELGEVVSFSGHYKNRNLYSLMFYSGNDVTFLHFSNPLEDSKVILKTYADTILNSYEYNDRSGLSVREKEDYPLFYDVTNNWIWYDDFRDGFYIVKNNVEDLGDLIAGLWTITPEELNNLGNIEEFDIEPFSFTLRIRNEKKLVNVYGIRNVSDKRNSSVYYTFKLDSNIYCLYIAGAPIITNVDINNNIYKDELQNLFDYNIVFTRGE
ncbi:MAG: hypothetical protein OCD02_20270 [Spirochaetaceae bacterium]